MTSSTKNGYVFTQMYFLVLQSVGSTTTAPSSTTSGSIATEQTLLTPPAPCHVSVKDKKTLQGNIIFCYRLHLQYLFVLNQHHRLRNIWFINTIFNHKVNKTNFSVCKYDVQILLYGRVRFSCWGCCCWWRPRPCAWWACGRVMPTGFTYSLLASPSYYKVTQAARL